MATIILTVATVKMAVKRNFSFLDCYGKRKVEVIKIEKNVVTYNEFFNGELINKSKQKGIFAFIGEMNFKGVAIRQG